MDKPLVFGIGMNKTGTSSLTAALYELGWPCLHSARTVKRISSRNRSAGRPPLYELTDKYRAFCDSPINYMFRELDAAYPGSKFILTLRDFQPWVVSRMAQFGGTPSLHRRKWNEHVDAVRAYFADRQDDILEYNLCGGDGWLPLCQFLQVYVPEAPFPWKNKTGARRKRRLETKLRFQG